MKIIKETPITMVELKQEVEKIKKKEKEPNLRIQKTEEYLNLFVHLKPEGEKELKEKINKLDIPRLKEEHINKIIDILPVDIEDLKTLLQGYTITVSKENMQKLIEVMNDIAKKK